MFCVWKARISAVIVLYLHLAKWRILKKKKCRVQKCFKAFDCWICQEDLLKAPRRMTSPWNCSIIIVQESCVLNDLLIHQWRNTETKPQSSFVTHAVLGTCKDWRFCPGTRAAENLHRYAPAQISDKINIKDNIALPASVKACHSDMPVCQGCWQKWLDKSAFKVRAAPWCPPQSGWGGSSCWTPPSSAAPPSASAAEYHRTSSLIDQALENMKENPAYDNWRCGELMSYFVGS